MSGDDRASWAEGLILVPWWLSVLVCLLGNIVIWQLLPAYVATHRQGWMQPDGYAGVKTILSNLFNMAMIITFVCSLLGNFASKRRK
jgi:hypothetical protein